MLGDTDITIKKDIGDLKDNDQWYSENFVDTTKQKEDV